MASIDQYPPEWDEPIYKTGELYCPWCFEVLEVSQDGCWCAKDGLVAIENAIGQ